MRHKRHKYKLGVDPSHRKSLMRNLSSSLIKAGAIKTTHAKAKAVQPYIERLVTLAKDDTVANRRLAASRIGDKEAVSKLFSEIGPKAKERNGGYTRVLKLADGRVGDNAKMSYIAFVD